MQTANVNGVTIEYEVQGSGEPLLMIHGASVAETFKPLMKEPALERYRKIRVHRRGYAGSSRVSGPLSFPEHAADAAALLRHLGVSRAHVAGHSYGGLTALRMALDTPEIVHSLVLIEPPLLGRPVGQRLFQNDLAPVMTAYAAGDKAKALETFALAVGGKSALETVGGKLGAAAYEQAVRDADTTFGSEFPAITRGLYLDTEAAKIRVPALSVVGGDSHEIFRESHEVYLSTLARVEGLDVPGTEHFVLVEKPREVAEGIARFLAKHPIS